MSSLLSVSILQSALEQGFIYALVALALYISFTTLNLCDLSTDGCFTLGCAVCAQVALMGHPFLALLSAMLIGVCSGFITAFLQTRLGVESILAGIIVNTGLYTVNLAVMGLGTKTGFSSTINMFQAVTVFDLAKEHLSGIFGSWYKLVVAAAIVLVVAFLLVQFFKTRLGLSIRATGDSPDMVRSSSINPAFTITVGLCLANALTALAGGLLGQYQKSCDINLGTGHGHHRPGKPHHRADAGGRTRPEQCGAQGLRRHFGKLPVPVYHRPGAAAQCGRLVPEVGLGHHCGCGHRHAEDQTECGL